MSEETKSSVESEGSPNEPVQPKEAMSYHAPTLQRYGGLAELVRNNPGVGADGGVGASSSAS
jgi:hypothetical protein